MKYLVTGASGFVGGHLVAGLLAHDHTVAALVRREGSAPEGATEHLANLTDHTAVQAAVTEIAPDGIFHLGAPVTSVRLSWDDPAKTLKANTTTAINVLEAARRHTNSPKVVFISSSEVLSGRVSAEPLDESALVVPDSPYATSKAMGEEAARMYADSFHLPVVIARPFNHIGPGQSPDFALPNFAEQIATIENGDGTGELKVGNLEAKRDFTDVRDVVAAYQLLMEQGETGEIYHIGAGQARSVRELLDLLLAASAATIDIVVDDSRFRPNENPSQTSDAGKLRKLGWKPRVPIDQTVADILADARERITKE